MVRNYNYANPDRSFYQRFTQNYYQDSESWYIQSSFVLSGESVEENANLVIRLLIRRPECLGPALRGEGEGLLQAIIEANRVCIEISCQTCTYVSVKNPELYKKMYLLRI